MRHLYLLPAAILVFGILGLPLVLTVSRGSGHFAALFSDATLGSVALTTLAFAAVSVTLEMAIGLGFALLLQQTIRARGLFRAIALIPWALPTAVMAMSWRWIFNDVYGVANDMLLKVGLLHEPIAWLGRPGTAFFALVAADVWKTTPFVTIILLAGLQSVPRDLHEAMSVDGAGPVRRFFSLALPLLRPAMAVAVTFRMIQALGIFDLVWVLTGGGPADSTRTLAQYVYETLFRYLNLGYGAALTAAVVLGAFLLASGVGAAVRGKPVL
ncbi:MAG: sugar ABC transporter permease [Planctomycetes bacterium]|nr:sugar ABC transporter permease [Planctomycetota bacterium]